MIAGLISSAASGARKIWNATLENPAMSLTDPSTWDNVFGGHQADSGIRVTHHKALQVAAVFQAVGMISGDIALMGANVFKKDENGDKEIDVDHPAEYLISEEPSENVPAFEFWRRLSAHACLWGNGYAYIERKARLGDPISLVNLLPDRTLPAYTPNGTRYYLTEVNGQMEPLFAEEVFHLKGISVETARGADLVAMARNSLGLAIAAEGLGSRFFANGAITSGIIELPPEMSSKAMDNVEEGFRRRTSGKDNWFKTIVLRDGAKFQATTIDAQKSQLIEVREEQVREVGRYFNLPPFKLGLEDSMAYNSSEMAQLVYLAGCLSHWAASIKGEGRIKLLTKQQRKQRTHFIGHDTSALLEIDSQTLNTVLEIQRRNEIINANEWRRKINMNRRKDPGGETYLNPNTKSATDSAAADPALVGEKGAPKPADDNANANNVLVAPLRNLFVEAVNRSARRVCFDARKTAKNSSKFAAWIDSKAMEHRQIVEESLSAPCNAIAAVIGTDADQMCETACYRFFAALTTSFEPFLSPPHIAADLAANIEKAAAEFEAAIAEKITPKALKEL